MKIRKECGWHVAAVIRKERRKRDLDQGVVAHRIGVQQSWLSRLEHGHRRICFGEFMILADAIGFDDVKAYRKISKACRKGVRNSIEPKKERAHGKQERQSQKRTRLIMKTAADATLTMVLADSHPRKCGGCKLCCKLLPMTPDLYPPERVNKTVDGMIDAGWAKPADFAGMVREWKKEAGTPCQHQRHRKGCAIYERRPFCCRIWNCRWLTGDDTADLPRPDRSRVVIDLVPDFITLRPHDGSEPTNIEVVQIWVDSKHPDAWRDPALLAYIERRGHEGKAALIRLDNKRGITVFPPSMSEDGQWHEVHNGELQPEHVGARLIEGLASSRKVKVG